MTEDTDSLVERYASRGVLVDSNLLLLLLVGGYDRRLVGRFKRTKQFAPEDYDTLCDSLDVFKCRVTTPNILTEVSNLANGLGPNAEDFFSSTFRNAAVTVLDEHYVPSNKAANCEEIGKFGLTDCAIMSLVKGKYLLLTEDFPLSQYLRSRGGDVVNFNHIRTMNWR
jgi:hypothetical protein